MSAKVRGDAKIVIVLGGTYECERACPQKASTFCFYLNPETFEACNNSIKLLDLANLCHLARAGGPAGGGGWARGSEPVGRPGVPSGLILTSELNL